VIEEKNKTGIYIFTNVFYRDNLLHRTLTAMQIAYYYFNWLQGAEYWLLKGSMKW
jgi:hypothetical protein